jgi:hypothetical protein
MIEQPGKGNYQCISPYTVTSQNNLTGLPRRLLRGNICIYQIAEGIKRNGAVG